MIMTDNSKKEKDAVICLALFMLLNNCELDEETFKEYNNFLDEDLPDNSVESLDAIYYNLLQNDDKVIRLALDIFKEKSNNLTK